MDEIVKRTDEPRTKQSITNDLKALGVEAGMQVIVHSSLSSLGWVSGGPIAVIQALMEVVTEEGTIVMPTQSADLSDPSEWGNPAVPEAWWDAIRNTMPAYDPAYTPTFQMGRIVETFRSYPGVKRSSHPNFSFAAWGKYRDTVINGQPLALGLGEQSPLQKLYTLPNSHILLLGVGFDNCTAFHLAEYRLPNQKYKERHAPVLEDGKRVWKSHQEITFRDELFPYIGESLEDTMYIPKSKIGSATFRIIPFKKAVDFAENWLTKRDAYQGI
ncbi:SPbeta prophage-derived aminoglycoside N(3')-acetyltransferase-like protein YokD [Paraliobacillus ryukyuensis]|uniref:Aminoglycoside N(3)-acetyltransferase n=1 Tax=Paraliobacillus ryukyuensis TaxID=200904 RepID=A0A366EDH8_9BACI|nr:AAC(3) family N-acetyltransferase [Paraliobacillus ryukyuensis]RBO99799.1 aminoglycoside 3-N-acetyltransferase [Paraliobacillus ryukyuensis]